MDIYWRDGDGIFFVMENASVTNMIISTQCEAIISSSYMILGLESNLPPTLVGDIGTAGLMHCFI